MSGVTTGVSSKHEKKFFIFFIVHIKKSTAPDIWIHKKTPDIELRSKSGHVDLLYVPIQIELTMCMAHKFLESLVRHSLISSFDQPPENCQGKLVCQNSQLIKQLCYYFHEFTNACRIGDVKLTTISMYLSSQFR